MRYLSSSSGTFSILKCRVRVGPAFTFRGDKLRPGGVISWDHHPPGGQDQCPDAPARPSSPHCPEVPRKESGARDRHVQNTWDRRRKEITRKGLGN